MTLLTERYADADRRRGLLLRPHRDHGHAARGLLRRGHGRPICGSTASGCSTIRASPSRCARRSGTTPNGWRGSTGWRSSSSARPTPSARRTASAPSWPSGASSRGWCISSRRWNPAPPSRPGTTRPAGKTTLRYKDGKCLHYYFYFIDAEFGLCYLRVPTWAPFRLQFYCNGHNWLAGQLRQAGIAVRAAGQYLPRPRRPRPGAGAGRCLPGRAAAPHCSMPLAARYCPVLAHFERDLPLEHHAGGVRHRPDLPPAGGPAARCTTRWCAPPSMPSSRTTSPPSWAAS